ncbi:PiggyBac transposable element-derived protein 3 [Araneus ventricosus]|uniref:PiggyBac transposable element-derived protein 3 n=1 Tax=Araneus ventricosus TaxID=182803 RepID=A0A4Y2N926_ARAVE|nr:PiggyBac transposable element-derived protein 3 [Araneus ventricosus]
MEHITYIDRGKRKVMTVDEFMALDVSSDSDDGLDFDDFSDEDPTINPKDLEFSDSDSQPETTVKKVKNSSSIIEKQVHPSIAEAGQPTSSNTSQPTESNINQPTSSNKKTDTGKCQILWKKQSTKFSGEPFLFTGHNALPQSILQLSTPYQFFKYFFTDEIVSKIADETNLYSTQKNPNKPVDCIVYDIHKFIGICILSSLAPPTCVRDLWNDVYGIDLVKETMSQRHFEKLHSSLHFNDNAKTPDHQSPDHDKLYKIRPILDYLNQRCLSVPMSERLSIDEQMCATKARHHMKMYMKDKPHKWGYKLYVLSGDIGFTHKFEIYSGQENDPKFRRDGEPDIGASGNVVIRLSREIPRNQNYKLYFDRYYSSLNLSVYLFQQGIQCVGTIQRNRIPNCKFRNDQELKKEPRGFSEEFFTNFESVGISTVLYKDNSNVAFLSTFVGEMPNSEVRRFDRKKKQHIMFSPLGAEAPPRELETFRFRYPGGQRVLCTSGSVTYSSRSSVRPRRSFDCHPGYFVCNSSKICVEQRFICDDYKDCEDGSDEWNCIKVWFRKFKAGNFDIEDEPRSGRPTKVDCEELKQMIDQDRNVSTRTIALELDVCQKIIVNTLKHINVTFKFNRWVPHELTAEDKGKRKSACLALLRDQKKEKILDIIVTCYEKWV